MGTFLSSPKLDKHEEVGHAMNMSFATCSMQGWRLSMEDDYCILTSIEGYPGWSFFAVFDGHGGAAASKYCAKHLFKHIYLYLKLAKIDENYTTPEQSSTTSQQTTNSKAESENSKDEHDSVEGNDFEYFTSNTYRKESAFDAFEDDVSRCIKKGFLSFDDEMRQNKDFSSGIDRSGSTVICILVTKNDIFIANCGDSRVIVKLADNSSLLKSKFDFLDKFKENTAGDCSLENEILTTSPDYKRQAEGELQYKDNGFTFGLNRSIFYTIDHKPTTTTERARIQKAGGVVAGGRVNYSLAVSRAVGDYDYKTGFNISATEQIVSAEPDVNSLKNTSDIEYIILACDGIWDVMTNCEVSDYVAYQLKCGFDLKTIIRNVLNTSLHRGSRDNMTLIIVAFENAPKFDIEVKKVEDKRRQVILNCINEMRETGSIVTYTKINSSLLKRYSEDSFCHPSGGVNSVKQFIEDEIAEDSNSNPCSNDSLSISPEDMLQNVEDIDHEFLFEPFPPLVNTEKKENVIPVSDGEVKEKKNNRFTTRVLQHVTKPDMDVELATCYDFLEAKYPEDTSNHVPESTQVQDKSNDLTNFDEEKDSIEIELTSNASDSSSNSSGRRRNNENHIKVESLNVNINEYGINTRETHDLQSEIDCNTKNSQTIQPDSQAIGQTSVTQAEIIELKKIEDILVEEQEQPL
ncbi:hypothetical protein A3Q56_00788 [Intoshia linei]|uniref:protein-serine/threonine phosphatase n=1 Tax=Intoshia linei TaxID=1819745 RepID=A0A177BCV1_9BILA|nr:hypothetical protein A3Q56_00788 [Intoshia linei]